MAGVGVRGARQTRGRWAALACADSRPQDALTHCESGSLERKPHLLQRLRMPSSSLSPPPPNMLSERDRANTIKSRACMGGGAEWDPWESPWV